MGQPEVVLADYRSKNERRASFQRAHAGPIGPLSPVLEIGANAGHSSYMLVNDFGADGFALDISADALRHGAALMDEWGYGRAPVRIGGDAANLPFADGSLQFVVTYQTLSQFTGVESVFREARRVLAPGVVFLFAEEPLRRMLTLRLYRTPFVHQMTPREKRLYDAGLLGFLGQDVIGSRQEEIQGIEQNHGLSIGGWRELARQYFGEVEWFVHAPERGWAERWVKRAALWAARGRPEFAAELLGGTVTGLCRKAGAMQRDPFDPERFEDTLRCPDCHGSFTRTATEDLACRDCGYLAPLEDGVYNLLPSAERQQLYPGDRDDTIDFCRPGHERLLDDGWYELEGRFGNRYRWMGARANARLTPSDTQRRKLRVRGFASEQSFTGKPVLTVRFSANANPVGEMRLSAPGLFVFETDLPQADSYDIAIEADPTFRIANDDRTYGVIISLIRLWESD
jgi:SAM-dependent methyltransferase